jgi:hypothetical protein
MISAFHPVANSFPCMSEDEFSKLLDDLACNGQKKIIALFEGKIWDGRARAVACAKLGIRPKFRLLKRKHEPSAYLISRHDRYGTPCSPERSAAVKILGQIWQDDWVTAGKRKKAEWLSSARAEFKQLEKKWHPCEVCGKHIDFVHAHHDLPLSVQFELGLEDPVHDYTWLCPVHHRIVHIFVGIYITETRDGAILDHVPDYKVDDWKGSERVFMRGSRLFKKYGGTSCNGQTWALYQ